MSKIDSQNTKILAYLKKGNKITSFGGLQLFGTLRLGARIFELRNKCHAIKTEIIETKSGKKIAEYSL